MPSLRTVIELAAASLTAMVIATAFASWMLVRLPADHFLGVRPAPASPLPLRVLKNVAGVAVVIVGLVMAIPGVPGPGLLTALVGLLLVDFPGKYRLERRVIRQPLIHSAVDHLRARFGRPPLEL